MQSNLIRKPTWFEPLVALVACLYFAYVANTTDQLAETHHQEFIRLVCFAASTISSLLFVVLAAYTLDLIARALGWKSNERSRP